MIIERTSYNSLIQKINTFVFLKTILWRNKQQKVAKYQAKIHQDDKNIISQKPQVCNNFFFMWYLITKYNLHC